MLPSPPGFQPKGCTRERAHSTPLFPSTLSPLPLTSSPRSSPTLSSRTVITPLPTAGPSTAPSPPALQRLLSPVPEFSTRTRPAPLPGHSSVAPTGRGRWRCPRPPGPQQVREAGRAARTLER